MAWFARREDGWEADSERVLRAAGIPVERLSPDEGARLFPSVAVDDLAFVLHEPEAGVLRAADGVRALVRRAREAGARLVLGEARPDAAAADGSGGAATAGEAAAPLLEADAVVWACGAWLGRLFPELVTTAGHLPAARPVRGPARVERARLGRLRRRLLRPRPRRAASASRSGPTSTASRSIPTPGRSRRPPRGSRIAREYLAHRFPALAGAPVASAPGCHYGLTPDGQFVFARHPEHESVWLLGGGSGHGFKHGPALAEHVAAVLAGTARAGAALRARRASAGAQPAEPAGASP